MHSNVTRQCVWEEAVVCVSRAPFKGSLQLVPSRAPLLWSGTYEEGNGDSKAVNDKNYVQKNGLVASQDRVDEFAVRNREL